MRVETMWAIATVPFWTGERFEETLIAEHDL